MLRTPRRRKVASTGIWNGLSNRKYRPAPVEQETEAIIENFSDDDEMPFLTPARSVPRKSKAKRPKANQGRNAGFNLDDDSFLIEDSSNSPLKLSQDAGDRIESFDSPKKPRKRHFSFNQSSPSLISSFPSPVKTPRTPSLFPTVGHQANGSRKRRISRTFSFEDEAEDPSIIENCEITKEDIEAVDENEHNCIITTDFSPMKINLTTAAFKNDLQTFSNEKTRRPPKMLRRPRNNFLNATPSATPNATPGATPRTQYSSKTIASSVIYNNNFLKSVYKQITKELDELEYQRLKFNRLPDDEKKMRKSVSLQILTMVNDTNLSVIEGEAVDLNAFDGTDPDETDLLIKKLRIILPKVWSEGMGLARFTVLQLYYPLSINRTVDDRLFLDNIFWIQVVERGDPNQQVREPIEEQLHKWECLCQPSIERPIPLCNSRQCQLKLQAEIEARHESKYKMK